MPRINWYKQNYNYIRLFPSVAFSGRGAPTVIESARGHRNTRQYSVVTQRNYTYSGRGVANSFKEAVSNYFISHTKHPLFHFRKKNTCVGQSNNS